MPPHSLSSQITPHSPTPHILQRGEGWGALSSSSTHTQLVPRALTHLSFRDAKNCIRGSAAAFPRPLSTVGATGVLLSSLAPTCCLFSRPSFSPVAREKEERGRETYFPLPPSPPRLLVRTNCTYARALYSRKLPPQAIKGKWHLMWGVSLFRM